MACSFNIRKNTLKIDNKKKGNYPFANISATNSLILMKFGTVYELPPKNLGMHMWRKCACACFVATKCAQGHACTLLLNFLILCSPGPLS